jgi:hypothetical protein
MLVRMPMALRNVTLWFQCGTDWLAGLQSPIWIHNE